MNNNQNLPNNEPLNNLNSLPTHPNLYPNNNAIINNQNMNIQQNTTPEPTKSFIKKDIDPMSTNLNFNNQNSQMSLIEKMQQKINNNTPKTNVTEGVNNNQVKESNLNTNNQSNGINNEPSYINDPQIKENVQAHLSGKKNTITITAELKTFIILALVMLVFIFVMPTLFDIISNIKYR